MSSTRFTAWLSEDERAGLRSLAHEHACSENFLVRIALAKLLFDRPIPNYLKDRVTQQK